MKRLIFSNIRPTVTLLVLSSLASLASGETIPSIHQARQPYTIKRQLSPPRFRQLLPPTPEQRAFNLPETKKPRIDLVEPSMRAAWIERQNTGLAVSAECQDMDKLSGYSGTALVDYLVTLPDYECHYGLFSLSAPQAAKVYTPANLSAVTNRAIQEVTHYNASNRALVNLLIYLRAAYYLSEFGTVAKPSLSLQQQMRPAISQLINNPVLFAANSQAPTTASELLKLITNMHDEAYYLNEIKSLVLRFTNTPTSPNAAQALNEYGTSLGFTSALTVFFYAHGREEGRVLLQSDSSYATALYQFVENNKAALLGSSAAFQLSDAARESFRFLQYPALAASIKPMVKSTLTSSSMMGADNELWLAAAASVRYYDSAQCSEYGTCDYETLLANAVLSNTFNCSQTIRIRAQSMDITQMRSSCALLQAEEGYFHAMLKTKQQPVKDDYNASLEVAVFSDYNNYVKYASAIFGIDTNNGGMYLEGNPSSTTNQARFIAHEASWLRPAFKIWNLEHEYIHYLDGRFDTYGDFSAAVAKPTVWWIEGLAEYLSLKNANPDAIAVARKGNYLLSQIFGNTYSMSDYVTRAYRWGYMATRFMVERHRNDVDAMVAKFRSGDYEGYQRYLSEIGSRYDGEFTSWVQSATPTGEPPLPSDSPLPECPSTSLLGKGCVISGLSSSDRAYAYIMVPAGAKNLKLWTTGGSGNVDMYLAVQRYPTPIDYDNISMHSGNEESIAIAAPQTNMWHYILLNAQQPFSGVSINCTYDLN